MNKLNSELFMSIKNDLNNEKRNFFFRLGIQYVDMHFQLKITLSLF